jgi:hypothetical protein
MRRPSRRATRVNAEETTQESPVTPAQARQARTGQPAHGHYASPLASEPLTGLGQELEGALESVRATARSHGGRVAMAGVLPTLRDEDLHRGDDHRRPPVPGARLEPDPGQGRAVRDRDRRPRPRAAPGGVRQRPGPLLSSDRSNHERRDGERPIPYHTATRPVAVAGLSCLPATVSRQHISAIDLGTATHDGAGGPPRNLRADPGRGRLHRPVEPCAVDAAPVTRPSLGSCTSSAATVRSRRSPLQRPPPGTWTRDQPPREMDLRRALPPCRGTPSMAIPKRTIRARREVELASVRDCYDDPHRRSLTAAPTPRPASLPRPLPKWSQ